MGQTVKPESPGCEMKRAGASYELATVRYPMLAVTATVEPFENGRGFSFRGLRAGKPRAASKGLTASDRG
jgi:hypothetical protein